MSTQPLDDCTGRLSLEVLEKLAAEKAIDTVICATPDPYGRLVGKRLTMDAFRRLAVDGPGVNASRFVFGVDIEVDILELPVANAENGYLDFLLVPDFATMRRIPWEQQTALVICDAYVEQPRSLLPVAPRTILKQQLARAEKFDISFNFASELEFFIARISPDGAWRQGYDNLDMLSNYRSDYQMLQSGRDEWFIRQIRSGMNAFDVPIETSKPEWGHGQQEITLDYASPLEMADRHILFKHGIKELAHRADLTASFMAKPSAMDVGSSCHIHASLCSSKDGRPIGLSEGSSTGPSLFERFVAGQVQHALELGVLFAPTVNAYKRFVPDQFAGDAIGVGNDNRSFAFRLIGSGANSRIENRIPGADINPYYAYSAMIAAGLRGIESEYPAEPIRDGNAWENPDLPHMWSAMRPAVNAFANSKMAAAEFGEEVHEHLWKSAEHEISTFESKCVTDWERRRYYDRA